MKKLILSSFLSFGFLLSFSQSKSYQVLENHFRGKKDVHAFKLNGVLCRMAVNLTTIDEPMLRAMSRNIRHIRLMVIPNSEFEKQSLSVDGFKSYLSKDSFEPLATVREKNDHISFFHSADNNQEERYFVVVQETNEVVASEMMGTMDPSALISGNTGMTTQKR